MTVKPFAQNWKSPLPTSGRSFTGQNFNYEIVWSLNGLKNKEKIVCQELADNATNHQTKPLL